MEHIQLISLILAGIMSIVYIATIWIKYGIQKSVSISFYALPHERKLIFRLFVFILSLGLIIGGNLPLFYISGGLLSLVGIFTRTKVKWKRIVHFIGAFGSIISAYIALILYYDLWIFVGSTLVSMILLYHIDKKNYIWWIEIMIMGDLLINLLIQVLK